MSLAKNIAPDDKAYSRLLPATSREEAAAALNREGIAWSWAGLRGFCPAAEQILGPAPIYFFNEQNLQVAEYRERGQAITVYSMPIRWGERTRAGLVRVMRQPTPDADGPTP